MTFRERVEAVLQGEASDRVPFAPYDNLVPRGDFERELRNRGMGLCLRCHGIWPEVAGVRVERRREGGVEYTTFRTPVGSVRAARQMHVGRIVDGGTLECEWPIKEVADFEPVIFMIENTAYHADYERYHAAVRDVATDGIVRFEGPVSPYESSYWEGAGAFFSLEGWVAAQVERPREFGRLMEALEGRVKRMMPLALEAPGDFMSLGWLGGVYGPKQTEEHMLPFYTEYAPRLAAAGKRLALHADATNLSHFADVIGRMGVHVVEAFTPPPVGDLSLAEARRAWGPEMVIWVNFPETIFWMGRQATHEYTLDLLAQDEGSGRLVMGMTEMGPYGVTDDESERLFKEGMRGIMDALEDRGR